MDRQNLINAWMIFDKGIIYDGGTGENDRPATDEEIQEAGLYIEKFIKEYKEPQLDSDIEELMKDIHKSSKFACENTTADGVPHVDYSIAVLNVIDDELYDSIKQALVDKDKLIAEYKSEQNLFTMANRKLQAKLNKIEKYIRTELSYGIVYDTIKRITKEVNNETD